MSDLILRHPLAFVTLSALGGLALWELWELWAHAFLLSSGYTGAASWSWWIRPLVEMMMS